MKKTAVAIGVIGGIGLGLLLGSEFAGPYTTLLGAGLLIISLLSMSGLSYRNKKHKRDG